MYEHLYLVAAFDSFPLAIGISLARDSRKTVNSIKLKKNDELLGDVQKTIYAGGEHQEEFDPPL